MKKSFIALLAAALLGAGAEETLSLTFNEAQEIAVNGKEYTIDGKFQDGCIAVGQKGFSLPGATLVGDNQGTLLLKFKVQDMSETSQRCLMTLRTASRLSVGFNCYQGGTFQFAFSDNTKHKFYFNLRKACAAGDLHCAVITWDGAKIKCYFDGKQVAEQEQPTAITVQVRNLYFGPYKDSWMAERLWKNEILLQSAKVFNTAITAEEAAELSK